MKKFLIAVIILILSLSSFSQWTWQNPLPQGNELNSVFFTSELCGYVVGECGTMLKTVDGGSNWMFLTNGSNSSLNSVFFTDSITGYVAGKTIYKTTDGGNTWVIKSNGTQPTEFNLIYFVNNNIGFAVGQYGYSDHIIYRTNNSGESWTQIRIGSNKINSIFFTDISTGYAVGNGGTILKTIDSGITWLSITGVTSQDIKSVYFSDLNTGYFVCTNKIFKTNDAGTAWFQLTYSSTNYLNSILFTDVNTGFAVGSNGLIIKTTNAGVNWSSVSSGTTNSLYKCFFPVGNKGYIIGKYGTIYKTNNSGGTWTSISMGFTNTLLSVFFIDAINGFASGVSGTLLKTTNGGESWISLSSGTNYNIKSIFFTDNNTGYYSVENSIKKTTDGGITWTTSCTSSVFPRSIYFIDQNTGFAVGDPNLTTLILKTVDAGNTWSEIPTGSNSILNSIHFPNSNTGYIVGLDGTILKTTDTGSTWTAIPSGNTDYLSSVFFTNENTGYVAGNYIYKTTDGGITWTPTSLPYMCNSLFFPNAEIGYGVSTTIHLYKTIDSGNTWIEVPSPTCKVLYSVYCTDFNTCYTVGYNGAILKTTNGGVFVEENQLNEGQILIYPNPSNNMLNININSSFLINSANIYIYDMQGRLVKHLETKENEILINVENLPKGMYCVRFAGDRINETKRIIKL